MNGDILSTSADTAATSQRNVGTYAITPHVTGLELGNYTVTPVNGVFTIGPAGSAKSLTTSTATSAVGTGVTFVATVASLTSGTPTGAVQFLLNGSTLATVPLASGTATFRTSSLAAGTSNVSATYSGDGNFSGSGSPQVTETVVVPDFAVVATPANLTIARGQSGTATFTITPVNGFAQESRWVVVPCLQGLPAPLHLRGLHLPAALCRWGLPPASSRCLPDRARGHSLTWSGLSCFAASRRCAVVEPALQI